MRSKNYPTDFIQHLIAMSKNPQFPRLFRTLCGEREEWIRHRHHHQPSQTFAKMHRHDPRVCQHATRAKWKMTMVWVAQWRLDVGRRRRIDVSTPAPQIFCPWPYCGLASDGRHAIGLSPSYHSFLLVFVYFLSIRYTARIILRELLNSDLMAIVCWN